MNSNNYLTMPFGAIYAKKETTFRLYSPVSEKVDLNLSFDDSFISFPMSKDENGVFSITVKGNQLNKCYYYTIQRNKKTIVTNDPFAKGVSKDSKYSAVVDDENIRNMKKVTTKKVDNPIIYELNIRDFTEENNTNIVNKGKYLGLVERYRKTSDGLPCGLDYLKNLGITHIQLQPVMDFFSLDDDPSFYNWGYDPLSYFALEGCYSTDPNNPNKRLLEFRQMVDILHKNGIKVILDVVYNHVYKYENSTFQKIYPDFYFRKDKKGKIANGSGCGNEIASEKPFVRKMIIDSLCYFLETFDVDGFRFDLMGLTDIQTLKDIDYALHQIKHDILLYGEGWNMGDVLPFEVKGTKENADKIPNYGFFNDFFRNILRGDNYQKLEKGYGGGDAHYIHGFEQVLFGSSLKLSYNPMFKNPNQSINYSECHDNQTLFDKYKASTNKEDNKVLKCVNFANALTILSFGIPFLHMGQEIGLSKNGEDNTYNMAKINNMNWSLIKERSNMVKYFKEVIKLKKMIMSHIKDLSMKELYENLEVIKTYQNMLVIKCKIPNLKYTFIINANEESQHYDFYNTRELVFSDSGYKEPAKRNKYQSINVPPFSVMVFKRI